MTKANPGRAHDTQLHALARGRARRPAAHTKALSNGKDHESSSLVLRKLLRRAVVG